MMTCFNCCKGDLILVESFLFSELGYEGSGIVQLLKCDTCKCEVENRVPLPADRIYTKTFKNIYDVYHCISEDHD